MNQPEPPPDPLSPQEQQALTILTGYGINCAPAYIGRARRYFGGQNMTAQAIIDHVMELIRLDAEQGEFLKTREKESVENELVEFLAAANNNPELANLRNILREMVDLERSKLAAKKPELSPVAATVRVSLYRDKIRSDCFIGQCSFLGRNFIVKATVPKSPDFINLEMTPTKL